jgi:hypothetical protein
MILLADKDRIQEIVIPNGIGKEKRIPKDYSANVSQ